MAHDAVRSGIDNTVVGLACDPTAPQRPQMDARPPGEAEPESERGDTGPRLIMGNAPEPHRSVITVRRRQESERADDEHDTVGELALHPNTALGFRAPAGGGEPRYPEGHPQDDDHESRS